MANLEALKVTKDALDKAITERKQSQELVKNIVPVLMGLIKPTLEALNASVSDLKSELVQTLEQNFKTLRIEIPEIKVPTVNVSVPPISVPKAEVSVRVPEIKLPVFNIPEIFVPPAEITVKNEGLLPDYDSGSVEYKGQKEEWTLFKGDKIVAEIELSYLDKEKAQLSYFKIKK